MSVKITMNIIYPGTYGYQTQGPDPKEGGKVPSPLRGGLEAMKPHTVDPTTHSKVTLKVYDYAK